MSDYDNPLGMNAERMRSIGYQTIDMLVRRLVEADPPPMRGATDAELSPLIDARPPEHPRGFEQPLAELASVDRGVVARPTAGADSRHCRERAGRRAPALTPH